MTNKLIIKSDTLEEIADAIRAKTGTTDPINPKNFAEKISDIEGGVGFLDGRLTEIITDDSITAIRNNAYRFDNANTTLTRIVLSSTVQSVGQYAFNQNINAFVEGLENVTTISGYSFQYVGRNLSTGFAFNTLKTNVTIGTYAFAYSGIKELSGNFTTIDNYAIYNCVKLTTVNVSCRTFGSYAIQNCSALLSLTLGEHENKTTVGANAFSYNYYVQSLDISDAVITSLGANAFQYTGNRRTNKTTTLMFDFRKSTLTSIPASCFTGESSSSYYNQNNHYYFPDTVLTIEASAFQYSTNCRYYFYSELPPTMSATTSFSNNTNPLIFVPYNSAVAYRTATNWTTVANYIRGFSDDFAVGDTLPTINNEGYGLTWYTDPECTIPAAQGTGQPLYCAVSAERVAAIITKITALNCNITITDGTKTYQQGDIVVKNTVLTISATGDPASYVPYDTTINGQSFTPGNTITVTEDLSINFIYWDGQSIPFLPTFADNSWDMIALACRVGAVPDTWALGDEKPIALTNGQNLTIRICDDKYGRYMYEDGSPTARVFEFKEIVRTAQMNTSGTNAGGWNGCYMRSTTIPAIKDLLPDDLKNALQPVKTKAMNGGSQSGVALTESLDELFLPTETEVFGARNYAAAAETTDQYQLYADNNTAAFRIKNYNNAANRWWTRSSYSSYTANFVYVYSNGDVNFSNASNTYGVAPCFAL